MLSAVAGAHQPYETKPRDSIHRTPQLMEERSGKPELSYDFQTPADRPLEIHQRPTMGWCWHRDRYRVSSRNFHGSTAIGLNGALCGRPSRL